MSAMSARVAMKSSVASTQSPTSVLVPSSSGVPMRAAQAALRAFDNEESDADFLGFLKRVEAAACDMRLATCEFGDRDALGSATGRPWAASHVSGRLPHAADCL